MATDVVEDQQSTADETADESPQPKRLSLSNRKVRVLILLVIVMAVEAVGMYLFIHGRSGSAHAKTDEPDELQSVETVEVPIDTFRAVNTIASPGVGYHVEFKLTAVVARDQEVVFEQAVTKEHHARIHQAVEHVVRSASMEELNDPKLNVIRRKIKEEINKALRKSYVHQVIISGFQPIAQ